MSLRGRPLWFEGQLIRPQHLQQLERWIEGLVDARADAVAPYPWGVHSLALDASMLPLGKLAIATCVAIMRDGTHLEIPSKDGTPPPLAVPPDVTERVVNLTVVARAGDGAEVGTDTSRYSVLQQEARDTTGTAPAAAVSVGIPRLLLQLDGEQDDDVVCLPVARIRRVDATGAVLLDTDFVPPSLRAGADARFQTFAREIEGMLSGRGQLLAARIDPSHAGTDLASMIDFSLLMLINTYEPVFAALSRSVETPPHEFHREAIRLAGALATFSRTRRRPPALPDWNHGNPGPVLSSLTLAISEALGLLSDEAATALPLQSRGHGLWVSLISDRGLLSGATFVLAVTGAMDPERIRVIIPAQAKLGPAEAIRDLVNLQLPGIPLRPMPVVPREIPYRSGTVYFELDRSAELWRQMRGSPAFVLHIGTEIPELTMEFWAIRQS
jgi:type VI secretion system protein ImpJ